MASFKRVSRHGPQGGAGARRLPRWRKRFPAPPANAGLVYEDGFGALTEDAFLNDFANGVDPVRARVLYAVPGRVSETLFGDRTTVAAWRSKPSWYAVSRQDRTTSPEFLRETLRHLLEKWRAEEHTTGFPDTREQLIAYQDRLLEYARDHLFGADFDPLRCPGSW